jgi:hypothetical protein
MMVWCVFCHSPNILEFIGGHRTFLAPPFMPFLTVLHPGKYPVLVRPPRVVVSKRIAIGEPINLANCAKILADSENRGVQP